MAFPVVQPVQLPQGGNNIAQLYLKGLALQQQQQQFEANQQQQQQTNALNERRTSVLEQQEGRLQGAQDIKQEQAKVQQQFMQKFLTESGKFANNPDMQGAIIGAFGVSKEFGSSILQLASGLDQMKTRGQDREAQAFQASMQRVIAQLRNGTLKLDKIKDPAVRSFIQDNMQAEIDEKGFVKPFPPEGMLALDQIADFKTGTSEGDIAAASGELTKKEGADLRTAEVSATNFIGTVGEALTLLNENPNINTFLAGAASLTNTLQQEVKASAKQLGIKMSVVNPATYKKDFDGLGIQNVRMKAIVTSLAYQRAKAADPGGKITEADVRAGVRELGGSSADPRAFEATLRDVANRTARGFITDFNVRNKGKEEFQGDLGISQLPGSSVSPQETRGGFNVEDLEFTAQQEGISVEEVLERLNAN